MPNAVRRQSAKPESKTKSRKGVPDRVIRDSEFARRMEQACDGHPHVPAKHSGRLTWIQRELENRFKEHVSVETVRKWLSGEAKPRPEKLTKLAELLEVDVAWLSLGIDPDLQPRERRMRNAMADGAVNLVAGLIQMDGGFPVFPDATAKGARQNHVDIHAIIKGAKYDFHVSLGEIAGNKIRFVIPIELDTTLVLGVIKRGFAIEIVELTAELIAAGVRHGGSVEMSFDLAKSKLPRIQSFANRL